MTNHRHQALGALKTIAFAAATAAMIAGSSVAFADPYNGGRQGQGDAQIHAGWGQDYGAGHQWQRGQRIGQGDWGSAQPVDYRQHHLRRPPSGYEWRQSNGQYVMAAVATGVIASASRSSRRSPSAGAARS